MKHRDKSEIVKAIKKGAIGILPTDTVYGIVCGAFNEGAVERMYGICKRDAKKPFIVILANKEDLSRFGVSLDKKAEKTIERIWPGKVSIVMNCNCVRFDYLHCGGNSIAFRVPDSTTLRELLEKTGPLATTSANYQGKRTAQTIKEAKKYFGRSVDFYVDGGKREIVPSTMIRIENNDFKLIREGAVNINNLKHENIQSFL